MQLGMIGLGRMGANLVRRLMRDGHECVVSTEPDGRRRPAPAEGATGATPSPTSSAKLEKPRAVVDHGPRRGRRRHARQLVPLLEPGDIVIDGGNSYYRDDIDRAEAARSPGIHYVDVGTAAACSASSAASA